MTHPGKLPFADHADVIFCRIGKLFPQPSTLGAVLVHSLSFPEILQAAAVRRADAGTAFRGHAATHHNQEQANALSALKGRLVGRQIWIGPLVVNQDEIFWPQLGKL